MNITSNKATIYVYCIRIRTRRGIYGQIYITLCLKEFPRAKPEGTPEGKGLYLTMYPKSSPNTDIISHGQLVSTLPRERTVKYTPPSEEILKGLISVFHC